MSASGSRPTGRFDAAGPVEATFGRVEGESGPGLLDQYVLVPDTGPNKVYEVPGVVFGLSARPTAGSTTRRVVRIWVSVRFEYAGGRHAGREPMGPAAVLPREVTADRLPEACRAVLRGGYVLLCVGDLGDDRCQHHVGSGRGGERCGTTVPNARSSWVDRRTVWQTSLAS